MRRNGKKYLVIPEREITCKGTNGYIQLDLVKDRKRYHCFAHRLVWIYFNGAIPFNMEINHKNGLKTDNQPKNLELVTRSENHKHAYKIGLKHGLKGERHPSAKLTENDVRKIRLRLQSGEKQKSIAQNFNVCRSNISYIFCKKSWSHVE